ncbi:phage protein NinX family protein [Morganella morganii]
MNKYRDKSDFEINKAVAVSLSAEFQFDDIREKLYTDIFRNTEIDYCNNPADAMPIIIENGICMAYDVFAEERDGGSWVAQPAYGFSDERVRSDNYYRAAMICFLIMKDAENEK